TRIRHVTEGRLDGVVLAAAGVRRLGRIDEATDVLDGSVMLPAPGQGALAIECRDAAVDLRADDASLREALRGLHDRATGLTVDCERAILSRAEAGCSAPIGALARLDGSTLEVSGVLADDEGTLLRVTRAAQISADHDAAHDSAQTAATDLGAQVAEELLDGLGIDPRKAVGANAPDTHLTTTHHAAGGDEGAETR
ncbi:MAG TPA: glutamyl-tRNA reductase, partial [Brevibacterium sp.]|nr:glutamyl-tRNA reductase [Brevibacterium sp.]